MAVWKERDDVADDVDDFFSRYEAEVRETARALRAALRRIAPDANETLHVGWKCVSYGTAKKFCAIAPHTSSVNLQFHAGAALDDPRGLLTGTGKSMRHVKLVAAKDVRRAGLAKLIREAAKQAG